MAERVKFLSRLTQCRVHVTSEANDRASRLHQRWITASYHPRIKGTVILIAAIEIIVPLIGRRVDIHLPVSLVSHAEHRALISQAGMPPQTTTVRAGAIAWVIAVQFFITQVVVATAWPRAFSLRFDYISDLGNTVCGAYPAGGDRLVCSPWHLAMNTSFMVLGVTMLLGAVLTRDAFPKGWVRTLAGVLFSLAGIGVFVVGIYPENTDNARHVLGAGLNFIAGNIAMVVYGLALAQRPALHPALQRVSLFAGALGFAGTLLFVTGHYLGIGLGGMERVAAYPMTVWQIVAGVALLRSSWGRSS